MIEQKEIHHFHLFAGLGGGAKGFNRASARVGNMVGRFRCLGGIDVDAGAMRDFQRLTGVPGTVLDLFDRSQYQDFHGKEPPAGWREAGPADIRRAAGNERPHIVFLSAPCKGFSGLLAEGKSKTDKYQALQSLVDPEEQLELDGLSDSAWRERIGNAVPPAAAQAIASEMGRTLLLAWSGETFALSSTPIWVRPVAVALSVAQGVHHG